jgi:hypothetical protein
MAHVVYISDPQQSDTAYFGGTDARAGNSGVWSDHQWVLGNIASGSALTATQVARHGVKVIRDGDVSEDDKLEICWSVAADQGKGTRLGGRVALNLYECYTAERDTSPITASVVGTTSFDLSGTNEADCGSFTIEPNTWAGCYYAVVTVQFTNVTSISQCFFNYGIGTVTEELTA